jgi:uncharacterized protein (TIGR02246 family)
MNRVQLVLGLTFSLVAGAASSTTGATQRQDDGAIRRVQERQADAWNRHEATAYANLFTKDGDVVNVLGWWWRGRSEIEGKLATAFAFVFRDSKLTITDVQVRFLSPVVAIAHVRWTMVGAKTPPGMPEPREGIQLQILTKQAGEWLIASFQNTNSVPEVPFPTEPPPTSKIKR